MFQLLVSASELVDILEATDQDTRKVGKDDGDNHVQDAQQDDHESNEGTVLKFIATVLASMQLFHVEWVLQVDEKGGKSVEEDETSDEEVGECGTDLKKSWIEGFLIKDGSFEV